MKVNSSILRIENILKYNKKITLAKDRRQCQITKDLTLQLHLSLSEETEHDNISFRSAANVLSYVKILVTNNKLHLAFEVNNITSLFTNILYIF